MPPSGVHFNGAVNLSDAETVMREIAARVPSGVRRTTEGETGDRRYWIFFQIERFKAMPQFQVVETFKPYETDDPDAPAMPRLRLAEGVAPEELRWPDLGYADAYRRSFELFERLQSEGVIAPGVRFQMQYPTPLAPIAASVVPEEMAAVAASYERALFSDLDSALAAIPHDRCAVQWDVAVEFGLLEGAFGPRAALEEIAPGLVRCIDHVPTDVPVGAHLCYGDYGHEHFKQPESLETQVRLANAVASGARREVGWFSFTVPQSRADEGYFAPLRDLRVGPQTELYFSLVPYHPAEQPPGTTGEQVRLIDAMLALSPSGTREWGICTECGLGRVAREDVPALLDLHREILATYGRPS